MKLYYTIKLPSFISLKIWIIEFKDSSMETGFGDFSFRQAVFKDIQKITDKKIVSTGCRKGLFAVINGKKN